jgi:hypothetical protein
MARLEGRRVQRMGLLPRGRTRPTVKRAPPANPQLSGRRQAQEEQETTRPKRMGSPLGHLEELNPGH